MSQSRFSIVLVGVSALLRRPLVSRLRPAGFTARGSGGFRRSGRPSVSEIAARRVGSSAFRFGDCHSAGWPSGSRLPLFGMHRFGVAARRVGLRAHDFRFSACTASGLPLGGLAFGLTASAFRHAPLRSCRWASWFCRLPLRGCRSAGWPSGSRLPLFGTHRFGVALVGLVLLPSASELPLGGLAFGLTASAFRHAPLRSCRSASWFCRLPFRGCPRRVGSSAFRFGDCRSAGWPSGSRLPLFGTHRFGVAARRVGLRAHRFRFSARTDPHRLTAEARADGAHRHDTCFTSKHLSQHVNLPHRSPQALQNRQTPLLSPTRHPRG